ncbi:hypothetical protein AKJ42_00005 [candidate division MSBL1 archaeon SCGC-AAA261C02]|uniref:Lipopolysaccharide assembly protein A domain-containing protein n=1 Tax=candidate division MSBL1 archaeon SCGC-AAA261C02 TaxID=1698272 RepID=A0A133V2E5_9EURY|nr:hypothetical protein AKJ42_00005 [candidate division MSBL1 archaeon SCGC-AAA261C02]
MSTSKSLGALLLVVTVIVAVLHVGVGYLELFGGAPRIPLAFALPVTAGVLAICALGFWLGWIMVTTKEPAPAPAPSVPESSEEGVEEESKEE